LFDNNLGVGKFVSLRKLYYAYFYSSLFSITRKTKSLKKHKNIFQFNTSAQLGGVTKVKNVGIAGD